MRKELQLSFLGNIKIHQDGMLVTEIQANKTLALLCYLAVTAQPHTRSALAGLLWGGMPEAKARGNLSKALSTLRRLLAEELGVEPEQETVALYERIRKGEDLREAGGPAPLSTASPALVLDGRFAITNLTEDLIGQGSMGRVYRGLDLQTDTPVAIKALKADLMARAPQTVERFMREGEALRRLNHPNIVKLLASVQEADRHYLVLEYAPGGSLQALLETEGSLAMPQVVEMALDLADALTRAHRLGIIHRDLKAANVLLSEDGLPRLTDFGIAHLVGERRLTETGLVLGTIDYLSPEAINGETTEGRADIWAFGVLLYEMLAGERPFSGQSIPDVMRAITTEPVPDLAQVRPDVSAELAALVQGMLVKELAQRIQSVR